MYINPILLYNLVIQSTFECNNIHLTLLLLYKFHLELELAIISCKNLQVRLFTNHYTIKLFAFSYVVFC